MPPGDLYPVIEHDFMGSVGKFIQLGSDVIIGVAQVKVIEEPEFKKKNNSIPATVGHAHEHKLFGLTP